MSEWTEEYKSYALIAIGAIPGAWLRMYMSRYLSSILLHKYLGTLSINIFACCLLGLFLALQANNFSPFILIISVGFLGSLSTFSTFIFEFLDSLLEYRLREAFSIALISIIGGLIAFYAGFCIVSWLKTHSF